VDDNDNDNYNGVLASNLQGGPYSSKTRPYRRSTHSDELAFVHHAVVTMSESDSVMKVWED